MKKIYFAVFVLGALLGLLNATRPSCPLHTFAWMGLGLSWHCIVERSPLPYEQKNDTIATKVEI